MRWNRVGVWPALAILISLSGCCSFCDKYCSHPVAYAQPAPVCCQPVCCQPATYAPPPAVPAQPGATWQNPAPNLPPTRNYYEPCPCGP
jgi:hypothetical protein